MHLVNVFDNFSIKHYENRKICQRAVSQLPESENRIQKLLLVRYLLSFLFRRIVEILFVLVRPHCIISVSFQDFELKLSTQTNFDTFILNLKFKFQYDIVMTS